MRFESDPGQAPEPQPTEESGEKAEQSEVARLVEAFQKRKPEGDPLEDEAVVAEAAARVREEERRLLENPPQQPGELPREE